ncbi:unnamed protein product [Heterosigma akashiwo]
MVHGGSGELRRHRGLGLAREVFELSDMVSLAQGGGRAAVGHVRYPTAGCPNSLEEAQPLVAPVAPGRGRGAAGPAAAPLAVALGHNGHLENVPERRAALAAAGYPLATNSDSEVLLLSLAAALRAQGVGRAAGGHRADAAAAAAVSPEQALAAVAEVMAVCVGGYAAVALVGGAGLLAFRDPHGIRPLRWGGGGRGLKLPPPKSWAFRPWASPCWATWGPRRPFVGAGGRYTGGWGGRRWRVPKGRVGEYDVHGCRTRCWTGCRCTPRGRRSAGGWPGGWPRSWGRRAWPRWTAWCPCPRPRASRPWPWPPRWACPTRRASPRTGTSRAPSSCPGRRGARRTCGRS